MKAGGGYGLGRLYTAGRESADRPSLGLILLAAAVAAAVLSPVAWLLLRAIDIGLTRAIELVTAPSTIGVLITSVGLVATVTTASVLLGVPLAVLTVQSDLPLRRGWTVALALPLVVPSYIGAFAYVSAFGPKGVLQGLLAPFGVEQLPPIYGFGGTTLVLTLYVYPYVFITTRASLLSMDTKLVEAARTLNHDRWNAFRRVTLPRILPGIAAGGLLAALYTLSDFGTPAIMRTDVFTRRIFVAYNTFARDQAALLSLQLLAVTVVILALESRLSGGDRSAYATRGTRRPDRLALGAWTVPALIGCTVVAGLALLVPLGVLLMWLFRSEAGYTGGLAFDAVFGLNSVYVATLAAGVAVVAALPVAYLSARRRSPLAGGLDRLTYFGFAIPGIVLGLALVYFGSSVVPALYQTLPLLVFAYVVRFLPQAVGTTRSSILQVDPRLVDAARTLGNSSLLAFRRVTLPLIAPGVAAGAALVFLTTMKELPATLLLRPTGFETLVTYIWTVQEAAHYERAAIPALMLVAVSAISMLVILAREGYDV